MLFKKHKNFEVAETIVQQQIDNAELIGDLLSQQYELNDSITDIGSELLDIVTSQQKAIRGLQENIMRLQKLAKKSGEAI